jgi:hypothetical protein
MRGKELNDARLGYLDIAGQGGNGVQLKDVI